MVPGQERQVRDLRPVEAAASASDDGRYRRLFETARDGFVLLDAETGAITHANPYWAELAGVTVEDVLGRALWEIAFEDADAVRSLVSEMRTRDFMRYEDLWIVRRDGTRRHVEVGCNAYPLERTRVIQCIVRDTTERVELLRRERAARAEAEAANRAKDDFLSVLSHELRTPLTAMLGWIRVLRRGSLDPAKTAEALETVERNTRLLAQLIEDLLDVSRIAAGTFAIEARRVELGAIVRAAAETIRESAGTKKLRLEIHLPETAVVMQGDGPRLRQVVWNLLSNAVKFTPEGGRIDLQLDAGSAGARITVSDTGRGIAPQFLPQIFDRFRQWEGLATRTQGGLGLGLTIVRHLVELHGGRIGVFSAGEGSGTTFTIDLPQQPALP